MEGLGTCIEWLDYAVSLRLLAALLGDGRCAILRASDAGLFPAQHIEFSHWVCNSGSALPSHARACAVHATGTLCRGSAESLDSAAPHALASMMCTLIAFIRAGNSKFWICSDDMSLYAASPCCQGPPAVCTAFAHSAATSHHWSSSMLACQGGNW